MSEEVSSVVQPTEHAADIYEVSLTILASCLPAGGVLKAGLDILVRKRMEEGQRILFDEISRQGVGRMSNEKWDYFIPAAYRFYEQVRIGEYQHNLRVLAKMIATGASEDEAPVDAGSVARAARKLEMLPEPFLVALSRCDRAFEVYEASNESDGCWICIDSGELKSSFDEIGKVATPIQCGEWLHELASRGLLTAGGRPSRVGGTYYYKNQIYDEVMDAVADVSGVSGDVRAS